MDKFDVMLNRNKLVIKNYLLYRFEEGKEEIHLENITPALLEESLVEIGAILNDDCDFNGWQCDYWYSFSYNNKKYSVDGSAWYGTASICLDK